MKKGNLVTDIPQEMAKWRWRQKSEWYSALQGVPEIVSPHQEPGHGPEADSSSQPQKEPILCTWFWTYGLWKCERINFCWGTWLQQPKKTKPGQLTLTLHASPNPITDILLRRKFGHAHARRTSHANRGRGWGVAAISQEHGALLGATEAGRILPSLQREPGPAGASIGGFCPPDCIGVKSCYSKLPCEWNVVSSAVGN